MVSVAGCLAMATLGHLLAGASPSVGPCPISCSATCGWCRCAETPPHPGRWTSGSTDGQVAEVGPRWSRRGAGPTTRRGRPLADPRPVGPARAPRAVDARLGAAGPDRHPLDRGGAGPGRAPARRGTRRPVVGWGHRSAVMGPPADRARARRGDRRTTGGADQRRRSPRLDQHRGPARAAAAGARRRGQRDRVVQGLPTAGGGRRRRRHLAGRLPAHDAAGRGEGRAGPRRPRVRPRGPGLARPRGGRRRAAARARRGVRRHARRLPRRRGADRPADARLRPAGHHGTAEDHLRRVAEHAHGVVLLGVRPRRWHRRAQHHQRGPAQRDARRQPAPARGGHPRHRRRRRRSRRSRSSRRPAHAVRSSTPS